MTIETRDDDFDLRPDFTIDREEREIENSALDIAASGFRRQNPLSNVDWSSPMAGFFEEEPGYDPYADANELKGFEPWADSFVRSKSKAETQHIKQKIQMENYDRKVLSESGWSGVLAELSGAASNPILWLSAATGPAGLGRTIAAVAAAEAGSELVLQGQQETRAWEESAINVVAAATTVGILGGAARGLTNYNTKQALKNAGKEIQARPNSPLKGTSMVDDTGAPRVMYHATHGSFEEISTRHGSEFMDPGMDVFNNLGAHFTDDVAKLNDKFLPAEGEDIAVPAGYWDDIGDVDMPYAPGANIRPVFLNIKKPFDIGSEDALYNLSSKSGDFDWVDENIFGDLAKYPQITEQLQALFSTDASAKEIAEQMRKILASHGYDGIKYVGELQDIRGVTAYIAFYDEQIVSKFDLRLTEGVDIPALSKQLADDIKSPGGAAVREVAPTNVNAKPPTDFEPPGPAWTPDQMGSKVNIPDAVAKQFAYGNPLMRLMTSPSNITRSVTESLLETPMYLRKNIAGKESEQAVETLIKVDSAPTGEALQATRDAFNKTQDLAPGEVNYVRARVKAGWRGEHHFKEAVGRALRRGDSSEDPLIASVAKTWREKVFNPLKERAMKLELFPEQQVLRKELTALEKQAAKTGLTDELTAAIAVKTDELAKWVPDPKGSDSYLTRLYNYQKLAEEADEFKDAVTKYLHVIEGITEAEAKKIARSIHSDLLSKDNMFGLPKPEFRGTSHVVKTPGGALRERTVTLPDNILEPWLISDIEHIGRTYTRRMATEINLAEKFGDRTLHKQINELEKDFEALVEATPNKKDKLVLHNLLRDNIRDLEASRDMLIGTYGLPSDPSGTFARGNRMARSWQYMVALGMQTMSALPDMFRPIVTNGLMNYAKGLSMAMPFMAKLAKEDVKRMGIGLDMLTSGRMRAIATMDEIPLVGGKFEHGLESMASGFGRVSGMDQWNSFWKQYSGIMAVDRIAQLAERGWSKLSKAEQAQLGWLGINDAKLNAIRGQFAKYGTKTNGFNVANIASWDTAAGRDLMAAATKEADVLIITPGKADKPLLASTDIGKTLFQFQSFIAAATNRMAVSGLAQRDMRVVQGLFMGVVMGAISTYAKDSINGRDLDWANDPVLIIANGLRQAGTLGLIAQVPVDAASAAYRGKSISRAVVDAIPGVDAPAEGLLRAGGNVLDAARQGDLGGMVDAGSKLMPYQNLFYWRQLFNEMGDGERSALGLKRPKDGLSQQNSPFGG